MKDVCRMIVLGAVAIIPMLILANELSEDEFIKSGAGVAMVAATAMAMKLLSNRVGKE